tara:strand:+ start:1158 stop:1475 length:318 start_codon:yes stop_codon:yes gene_type:complete
VVNPDGQVFPCCYFANNHYFTENDNTYNSRGHGTDWWHKDPGQQVMAKYEQNKSHLNVNNKTIEEVLSHEWYEKTLPESWEKQETRDERCIRYCQVEHEGVELYD